jgi:hypothetical protein
MGTNSTILRYLHEGIALCMKHLRLGLEAVCVVHAVHKDLTGVVLVSSWHAVVAVTDDLTILDDESPDLKPVGF